jgi:hypothetical protein
VYNLNKSHLTTILACIGDIYFILLFKILLSDSLNNRRMEACKVTDVLDIKGMEHGASHQDF